MNKKTFIIIISFTIICFAFIANFTSKYVRAINIKEEENIFEQDDYILTLSYRYPLPFENQELSLFQIQMKFFTHGLKVYRSLSICEYIECYISTTSPRITFRFKNAIYLKYESIIREKIINNMEIWYFKVNLASDFEIVTY